MGLHEWQSARSAGIAGLLAFTVAAGTAAAAAPPACFGSPGEQVQVAEAIDGDTLRLDDGRVIRLAGIEAPKRPLALAEDTPWPLGDAAREALSDRVGSRSVSLHLLDRAPDRHGRHHGRLITGADGGWVEREMVAGGFARVRHFPGESACSSIFLPRKKLRAKPQSVSGLGRNSPFSAPMILRFGHETAYMNWSRVG